MGPPCLVDGWGLELLLAVAPAAAAVTHLDALFICALMVEDNRGGYVVETVGSASAACRRSTALAETGLFNFGKSLWAFLVLAD